MTDDTDDDLPKTWQRGLPPHEPTEESRAQVAALTSFGISQDDIALYLDIDDKTLRKYYRRELDTGSLHATAKVASRLFATATQSVDMKAANVAGIFWLKCRAGWRDVSQPVTDDPSAVPPTDITVERKNARIAE